MTSPLVLEKPPFAVVRQFVDSASDAKVGWSVEVTEYRGTQPVAYTRGALGVSTAMIRGTPVALSATGAMSITVYDSDGCRLTVYDKDRKSILYQEDYDPRAIRATVDFLQGVPD